MATIRKTKNNLQKVWNELDLAYENMERAIETLSKMSGLPIDLLISLNNFDISAISSIKNSVEELMND